MTNKLHFAITICFQQKRRIDLVTIENKTATEDQVQVKSKTHGGQKKRYVVIMARTHGGEPPASFICQGRHLTQPIVQYLTERLNRSETHYLLLEFRYSPYNFHDINFLFPGFWLHNFFCYCYDILLIVVVGPHDLIFLAKQSVKENQGR